MKWSINITGKLVAYLLLAGIVPLVVYGVSGFFGARNAKARKDALWDEFRGSQDKAQQERLFREVFSLGRCNPWGVLFERALAGVFLFCCGLVLLVGMKAGPSLAAAGGVEKDGRVAGNPKSEIQNPK